MHHRNVPVVTLDIFNTNTLICEYVDYLSKVRKLMPNTITVHLTCIIVIKYNFREDWSALVVRRLCRVDLSYVVLDLILVDAAS
jgi:hypothetical protein